MTLVFVSIPIMVFVVALAVIPGLVATYRDAVTGRGAGLVTRLPSAPKEKEIGLAA